MQITEHQSPLPHRQRHTKTGAKDTNPLRQRSYFADNEMTEAIQNQEEYYDLVWQLLDVAEELPVDFLDQMQGLM